MNKEADKNTFPSPV